MNDLELFVTSRALDSDFDGSILKPNKDTVVTQKAVLMRLTENCMLTCVNCVANQRSTDCKIQTVILCPSMIGLFAPQYEQAHFFHPSMIGCFWPQCDRTIIVNTTGIDFSISASEHV